MPLDPAPGLPIRLARQGGAPLALQLYRELRQSILGGRLPAGTRLPPSRTLARSLAVSRNTVLEAFDRLASEGFIAGRTGAGTWVTSRIGAHPGAARGSAGVPAASGDRSRDPAAARPARRAGGSRSGPAAAPPAGTTPAVQAGRSPAIAPPPRFDFRIGLPDPGRFPFAVWRRLLGAACRAYEREAPRSLRGSGGPALPQAIADHVAFARGVACSAADLVVTAGAQQALDLLARVLADTGTPVAFENPGYPFARAAFVARGARVLAVPVDREGLVVGRIPPAARVVYVTPSHQFPLGVPLSLERRMALVDWAGRRRGIVIEDDYDAEFRYEGRMLESLQSLDRDRRVVYVGTFSKSMFPGLRLGFLVAPPALRERIEAARRIADGGGNPIEQAALARFIADGHLARHVRRMGRLYASRRERLLEALGRCCSGLLEPLPAAAGLHLTALFREPLDGEAVCARASAKGVAVQPLSRFRSGGGRSDGLVFGFGLIEESAIGPGIQRLAEILEDLPRPVRQ